MRGITGSPRDNYKSGCELWANFSEPHARAKKRPVYLDPGDFRALISRLRLLLGAIDAPIAKLKARARRAPRAKMHPTERAQYRNALLKVIYKYRAI